MSGRCKSILVAEKTDIPRTSLRWTIRLIPISMTSKLLRRQFNMVHRKHGRFENTSKTNPCHATAAEHECSRKWLTSPTGTSRRRFDWNGLELGDLSTEVLISGCRWSPARSVPPFVIEGRVGTDDEHVESVRPPGNNARSSDASSAKIIPTSHRRLPRGSVPRFVVQRRIHADDK